MVEISKGGEGGAVCLTVMDVMMNDAQGEWKVG
jgi:hypothetical protein